MAQRVFALRQGDLCIGWGNSDFNLYDETRQRLAASLKIPMTKMALETIEYTRMMLLFAVSDFIKASMLFASIDNWSDCIARLRGALDELDAELFEVSSKIGGI